jgi:glycosyltransferase involved in cell wall biosynthesis
MPQARLLDLSRLVSRLGQGPLTGIDRAELAYLQRLAGEPGDFFGLVRTGLGFLLLDRAGALRLADQINQGALPKATILSRIIARGSPDRARALSFVRTLAVARAPRVLLARMLRKKLPVRTIYINVGHTNLTNRVLCAVRALDRSKIVVMIHDTIPLDHPEYCRADTIEPFARKLANVAKHADLVLHLTEDARTKTEAHFSRLGRVPPGVTYGLGVVLPDVDARQLPAGLAPKEPYFVVVGTIEPRKNHALLLQVWADLATRTSPVPDLYIVGKRGWNNAAVLTQLDALPPESPIKILPNLPDEAVLALVQGARALLFPSFAEGYGLPPIEAASLGTPVICADLAVIREVMADFPVYLSPTDSYSWVETIILLSGDARRSQSKRFDPPTWENHFLKVLREI